MILRQKQKVCQRLQPAYQFDNFLRIRQQKQCIIQVLDCLKSQSQSQPITQKVQGFEQLLKLTKSGSSICPMKVHKRQLNNQIKNKKESSKTINVIGKHDSQFDTNNRFEDVESEEAQLKKLNKMVLGLTEWESEREKPSLHVERKGDYPRTSKLEKRVDSIPRQQKAKNYGKQFSCSSSGKFRKFYSPLNKYQSQYQLTRKNSQLIRTSSNLNYPKNLLKDNLFSQNEQQFKQLKDKIKVLQNRAKRQYGLNFERGGGDNAMHAKNYQRLWGDDDSCEEKENDYQFQFNGLELGPILAKQLPSRYKSYAQMVTDQNINATDSSVPKSLIDVVQKAQSSHQFTLSNTKTAFGDPLKIIKMKKGYLYRPRSFKPAYEYVRI